MQVIEKLLFVDDDPKILSGFERKLVDEFEVVTALGPEKGLEEVQGNGPFAIIVSDMQMPGMDGVQFLSKVREIEPDSVRMILTGFAELETAIEAVNEGNIFRFLTKPCPSNILVGALQAGIRQYELVRSERELLEKTLSGSVKVLVDILSLTSPVAFGRANRVRVIMVKIAEKLHIENKWEFELAGMLSQTGCITLPVSLLEKINKGKVLTGLETSMYEAHPTIGHDILVNIPRLESIAKMIMYQGKHYDGSGFPKGDIKGDALPIESRALHIIVDFDTLVRSGDTKKQAVESIKSHNGWYDPTLVKVLDEIVRGETRTTVKTFKVKELLTGAVLAEDVKTTAGTLLVAKGQPVSRALRERLVNFCRSGEGPDKVNILITEEDFR